MNILFVNACVRKNSRTNVLARYFLEKLKGEITEINLEKENIQPLNEKTLEKRNEILEKGELDSPVLKYAKQFANADLIVFSAPFWDLSFPAMVKNYIEAVCVSGVTFCYENNQPKGLCKAKKLVYITTAGGPVFVDFGYSYLKALAQSCFGIPETLCIKAENLDVIGNDTEKILNNAKNEIDKIV